VDSPSWAKRVEEAASPETVVQLVGEFLASRDGGQMSRLPRECLPPTQLDRDQIADFAYRLVSYHGHDEAREVVEALSGVVSRAAVRLAELERRSNPR